MASEIGIRLTADPSDLEAATKRAATAFQEWERASAAGADDVADKLEEVISSTVDLGRKMGRTEEQITTDLQAMGFSADDARDSVKRVGDEAGDVGDGVRSLGEIARSALEGDFAGAADSALGSLEALLGIAGIGGIAGAAASAAGELGLGLILGAIEANNAALERSKQRASEWADAFIAANGRALEQTTIAEGIRSIQNDTEKLTRAQRIAQLTGVELTDVIAGMADPFGAMGAELNDSVNQALDEYAIKASNASAETGTANAEATAQASLLGELSRTWKQHTDEVGAGSEAYTIYTDAAARAQVANLNAAVAAGQATVAVDEFGDSVYTLPDGKQVYVDAETGQATEDVNAIETKIFGIPDGQSTVHMGVDSWAYDNWQPAPKYARVIVQSGVEKKVPYGG